MKIIVAAGALKGSLSAEKTTAAIITGLARSGVSTNIIGMPIADGGDGTLEAFLSRGGTRVAVTVSDALGRQIKSAFGMLPNGAAVIEMALAVGLGHLDRSEVTPENSLRASTYGLGELISAALDHGARRIIIGLGGSATTDGGTGCLRALGVRFLDAAGGDVPPGGGSLDRVAVIDATALDARLRETEIILAADVTAPAVGEGGAARVYAPQKGASPLEVEQLDANLTHLFTLIHTQHGIDVRTIPGGGAAGATAAGLFAFTGARMASGIDTLLDMVEFDQELRDTKLVITSEGRLDDQTLQGKSPIGVARRAAAYGVPTIALAGGVTGDESVLYRAGLIPFSIVPAPMPLDEALRDAETLVERAALRLGYLLKLGEKLHR